MQTFPPPPGKELINYIKLTHSIKTSSIEPSVLVKLAGTCSLTVSENDNDGHSVSMPMSNETRVTAGKGSRGMTVNTTT